MWNKKGVKLILFSFAVILILLTFINIDRDPAKNVGREKRQITKDKFTFADTYNSKFAYKGFSVTWISADEYVDMIAGSDIIKKNVTSSEQITLMTGTDYNSKQGASYKVSADLKYILILTNYKKGWRHSYNGTYFIYDVDNAKYLNQNLGDDIQYVTWSPVGNALAYVKGFNICYRPSVASNDVQVTNDGEVNKIYNGIPDWVYEEEMISSNNVMYFSPNGAYLAYAQFNDTECKHIKFSRYDGKNYPPMQDVSYPKAGTTQPTNKVFVYSVNNDTSTEVPPPSDISKNDFLFNRVTWSSATRFAVSWSNRVQNSGEIKLCRMNKDVANCAQSDNYKHSSTTGWIYQRRPYWIPVFGNTDEEYFTVKPNNGWQHIFRVDMTSSSAITSGEYTVTSESASYPSVIYYDKVNDYVYFAARKISPQKQQIYRTKGQSVSQPQCLTCKLMDKYTGRCDFVSTQFSKDASNVIVRCSGDNYPPVYVLYGVEHSAVEKEEDILVNEEVVEDNQELVDTIDATDTSTKEYGTFTSSTGYDFTYQIFYPPNFDDSKKYPLLVDVYAGPGYQRVYPAWSRGWSWKYVPSALDVVVISVDTRGSNFYGDAFMHEVYRKLGQKEPIDQLEAIQHFTTSMSFIDSSNVAVWGWSYGGYATSHVLGNDNEHLVKCGFAVAPLTDWRFYDTIYAERYMGLPTEEDNVDNYDKAAVLSLASNFRSGSYYLIHGTADDNVHFQNAARLAYALVEADVDFNNFFYADQDHSINVGNANYHVDKVLTRQVCQCFNIPVPEDLWT